MNMMNMQKNSLSIKQCLQWGGIALALIYLPSCAVTPSVDVTRFVEQTLKEKTEKRTLLQEEPLPASIVYTGSSLRNPFEAAQTEAPGSPTRGGQKEEKIQVQQALRRPEHPKQVLENFPLDSLKMVGLLEKNGELWALIQDNSSTLHKVGIGHYMGQNQGKIIKIHTGGLEILETIPDGEGGWRERPAALKLAQ